MHLKSVFAAGLIIASACAIAADEEVETLLSAMREAYKGAKTAKLTVSTTMNFEEKEVTTTFEATFKGPDKLYMYTDKMFGEDGKYKVVSDGKTITFTSPEDKDEVPFSIELLSGALPLNLETLCFWDYKRQLSTSEDGNMNKSVLKVVKEQEWDAKKWTVLEETAEEQGVNVKYWIDDKTKLIWKTEVVALETKQKVMTCVIKNLELNSEVEDSLFGG